MPKICNETHRQCQDTLMYLLFHGGSDTLLRTLIERSVNNILGEFPYDNVRDALRPFLSCPSASIALLRAIFVVLLHRDGAMRSDLCETQHIPQIPRLCPQKACRLYNMIAENIDEWVKDERIGTMDFVEVIKDSYLVA